MWVVRGALHLAYKAMQAQKGIPVTLNPMQARLTISQKIHLVTVFITIGATVAVHLGLSFLLSRSLPTYFNK